MTGTVAGAVGYGQGASWARAEACFVSEQVTDLIADYVRFRAADSSSLIDPWARAGHMLPALAARLGPETAVGFCDDHDALRDLADRHPATSWQLADPDGIATPEGDGLGVVVGMPPWHWAPRRLTRSTDDGVVVEIGDDPANVAIIDIGRRLGPRGLGFFVVGPGFLLRPGPSTAMARLPEFGLHIDGVIELPRGAIRPDHGVAQLILVLARREQPRPLLGKMSLAPDAFKKLHATQSWLGDTQMPA